jgi:WD40 repeat protein
MDTTALLTPASGSPYRYAAFASYTTDPDYRLVRKVEAFLESFHRLPTPAEVHLQRLEVCVDDSGIARPSTVGGPNDPAHSTIFALLEQRLRESKNLLVFCSCKSPCSKWMAYEIEWFLANRGPDAILLAVTEGDNPSLVPEEVFPQPILHANLHRKPWYDFRGFRRRQSRHWTKVRDFEDALVQLAAHLNDLTADRVQPLWEREQRRRLRRSVVVASGVAAAMAILAFLALALWQLAESRARISGSQRVAADARAARRRTPQRGLLLAVEATRIPLPADGRVPEVDQTLRDALANLGGYGLWGHRDSVDCVALSPDEHWLATGGGFEDKTVRLWDLTRDDPSQSPLILRGQTGWVGALAFSPDNRWLVTAAGFRSGMLRSPDHAALFWDLHDAKALAESRPARTLTAHEDEVSVIAFSPDGRFFATGCGDNKVRIWPMEATGPAQDCQVLGKHADEITGIALSQEGRRALTASRDGVAMLWDLAARTPVKVIRQPRKGYYTVGFSADLRWVAAAPAVAGPDRAAVRLWDLTREDVADPLRELPIERVPTFLVRFSPNGRWLLTAPGFTSEFGEFRVYTGGELLDYRTTRLWDLQSKFPEVPYKVIPGGDNPIYAAQFTPNSQRLLTAGADGSTQQWNLLDGNASAAPTILPGHDSAVWTLDVGERWLATGGRDRMARVRQLAHPESPSWPRVLWGAGGEVEHVQISPDQHWLAAGTQTGAIHLWSVPAAVEGSIITLTGEKPVTALLFTGNSERLIAGRRDGRVELWNLPPRNPNVPDQTLTGPVTSSLRLAATANGGFLAVDNQKAGVCLWEPGAEQPEKILRRLDSGGEEIRSLAWSPDGRWLMAGGENGTAHLWDFRGDPVALPHTSLLGHEQTIASIAFSSNSRWAVTGSWDKTARIWDLYSPQPDRSVRQLSGHRESVTAVAVTPDLRWVITGSSDGTLRLWRLGTHDPSPTSIELRGHEGGISALEVSADSRWVLSGSEDRTCRLWDLGAGAPALVAPLTLTRHRERVRSVALSRHWAVSGSLDQTAQLTPLRADELVAPAPPVVGRNLLPEEWKLYFPDRPYRRTLLELPESGD